MVPKDDEFKFSLPPMVTGPVEVGRLLREVEAADEVLLQAALRNGGKPHADDVPEASKMLDRTLEVNHFKLSHKDDRARLIRYLGAIKDKAPVLHMSLVSDPTADFKEKIVTWIRREVHPYAMLTVGLQPSIGAGCMLRTTNKYFDMSLKNDFIEKKQLLIDYVSKKAEAAA